MEESIKLTWPEILSGASTGVIREIETLRQNIQWGQLERLQGHWIDCNYSDILLGKIEAKIKLINITLGKMRNSKLYCKTTLDCVG
jgi:hypothetical protein